MININISGAKGEGSLYPFIQIIKNISADTYTHKIYILDKSQEFDKNSNGEIDNYITEKNIVDFPKYQVITLESYNNSSKIFNNNKLDEAISKIVQNAINQIDNEFMVTVFNFDSLNRQFMFLCIDKLKHELEHLEQICYYEQVFCLTHDFSRDI